MSHEPAGPQAVGVVRGVGDIVLLMSGAQPMQGATPLRLALAPADQAEDGDAVLRLPRPDREDGGAPRSRFTFKSAGMACASKSSAL